MEENDSSVGDLVSSEWTALMLRIEKLEAMAHPPVPDLASAASVERCLKGIYLEIDELRRNLGMDKEEKKMEEQFMVIHFAAKGPEFKIMGREELDQFLNVQFEGPRTFCTADTFSRDRWIFPGRDNDGPELDSYMIVRDPFNTIAAPTQKTTWELP